MPPPTPSPFHLLSLAPSLLSRLPCTTGVRDQLLLAAHLPLHAISPRTLSPPARYLPLHAISLAFSLSLAQFCVLTLILILIRIAGAYSQRSAEKRATMREHESVRRGALNDLTPDQEAAKTQGYGDSNPNPNPNPRHKNCKFNQFVYQP
jgi:hypothetical protein